jgi:hypothetical protein
MNAFIPLITKDGRTVQIPIPAHAVAYAICQKEQDGKMTTAVIFALRLAGEQGIGATLKRVESQRSGLTFTSLQGEGRYGGGHASDGYAMFKFTTQADSGVVEVSPDSVEFARVAFKSIDGRAPATPRLSRDLQSLIKAVLDSPSPEVPDTAASSSAA